MSHHRWGLSAPNVIPKNFGEGDGPLRRTRTQIRAWIQRDARRVFRDLTRHRSGFPPGRRQGGHPRFYTRVPVRFYPSWSFLFQRGISLTAVPNGGFPSRNGHFRTRPILFGTAARLPIPPLDSASIHRGANLRLPLAHRAGR